MNRIPGLTLLWVLSLYGFLLLTQGSNAIAEEPSFTVSKPVKLGKCSLSSPCFQPILVNDELKLPGKDGKGFAVEISDNKVLVDVKQNGRPSFVAITSGKSKPFDLTLYYPNGDEVKQTFVIEELRGVFFLKRESVMEVVIDGQKVWICDDNNNGIYGENNKDSICLAKSSFACPQGSVVLIGTRLYELKVNESGLKIEYRAWAGSTGKVDVLKGWGGSVKPETAIFCTKLADTDLFFDLACGEVTVPCGSYRMVTTHLNKVEIRGNDDSVKFRVEENTLAVPDWGKKLELKVQPSYNKATRLLTIYWKFGVCGQNGEIYTGEFEKEGTYKVVLMFLDGDGKQVSGKVNWSLQEMRTGTGTIFRFDNLELMAPKGALSVSLCCSVPGVGEATTEFPLE